MHMILANFTVTELTKYTIAVLINSMLDALIIVKLKL